jgi:hypothetical protein
VAFRLAYLLLARVPSWLALLARSDAAKDGYLVTTSWLSPRSRQRARSQRIHTIERNQLAAMVKDLLGFDIVISNALPAYQDGASRPRRRQQPADR